MGIYLSTPSTEVELEEGSGEKVRFVVGEMQGWRKSMEDAHIALADIKNEAALSGTKFSLFAVFDGHGGKEVAKFAKIHYPKLVLEQLVANEGDVAMALRESFHRVDELLEEEHHWQQLKELKTLPNPCDRVPRSAPLGRGAALEDSDSDNEGDNGLVTRKATQQHGTTPSGFADEDSDNMISTSDAVRMIRDMLKKAAARGGGGQEDAKGSVLSEEGEEEGASTSMDTDSKEAQAQEEEDQADDAAFQDMLMDALTSAGAPVRSSAPKSTEDKRANGADAKNGSKHTASGLTITMHENCSEDTDASADSKSEGSANGKHSDAKALEVPTAEDKAAVEEDISPKPVHTSAETDLCPGAPILPPVPSLASALKRAAGAGADVSPVQASRKTAEGVTCNLKPHRLMAGCTAVVAMHLGNKLYVANAGDSRGVLCRRNGQAWALSYDHKPQSDVELNRILGAGGFVNAVGRINGNLNLSRSLGDLKYKQVVQCSREEQMITAEPDITLTELQEGDRFFILACDGVWDCLSNQQACDFVSVRLDQGKDVATITREVLHHCLAPDTASAAGVGCDNMTFLLVLLNQ